MKPSPPLHYPKDMIGWFIVQVLDKCEEEDMKSDLLNESSFDDRVIENVYDSYCIWEVKELCEDRWLKKESVEFDDEDGTIMECIANMIEGCCLFERELL